MLSLSLSLSPSLSLAVCVLIASPFKLLNQLTVFREIRVVCSEQYTPAMWV